MKLYTVAMFVVGLLGLVAVPYAAAASEGSIRPAVLTKDDGASAFASTVTSRAPVTTVAYRRWGAYYRPYVAYRPYYRPYPVYRPYYRAYRPYAFGAYYAPYGGAYYGPPAYQW